MTERRRSRRIKAKVPALLVSGAGEDQSETTEIGLGGIFVLTSREYELHQLVQLELSLPTGQSLVTQGMIVRVVGLDDAEALSTEPGVGIQFYGLGPSDEREWREYVTSVSCAAAPSPTDTIVDARAPSRSEVDGKTAKWKPSVEDLARAAGIDVKIFAAAVCDEDDAAAEEPPADDEESPRDTLVEGVPASTDAPRAGAAPPPAPRVGSTTLGPHAKPIHIIGPDSPAPPPSPAPAKKLDPDRTVAGFRVLEESSEVGYTPAELAVVLEPNVVEAAPAPSAPEPARVADEQPTIPRLPAPAAPQVDAAADEAAPPAPQPESVAIVPLAPTGLLRQAVYRIEVPTVAALEQFSQLALGSGGVFVRTDDLRPNGSPAVVCVVHPTSRDEFHIPGTIIHARPDRPGVSIRFAGVRSETYRAFRQFIALGARKPSARRAGSASERFLTVARPVAQGARPSIPSDTRAVAPDSIEPYPKRRSPV